MQLPPVYEKDLRRRIIERYKRHLFHVRQGAGGMKKELTRLLECSSEHVAIDLAGQVCHLASTQIVFENDCNFAVDVYWVPDLAYHPNSPHHPN